MREIHLICNAHIDPIWQWDWQEGVSAVLSTFNSAVKLAEEFDYVFCHNEVTVYKYVEEYAPDLFKKIQKLVKKGKWRIMGGWYLQPDCNMPSGESFTRQALFGKEYFIKKFGYFPKTAINFDPFGHNRGLVQIIKKCGQDSYIFMRPYPNEMKLEEEQFIWEGYDGSKIKANRSLAYNTPLGASAEEIAKRVKTLKGDVVMVLWGVGNHGGGPSKKDLADIKEMMEKEKSNGINYIHSYPEKFFPKIDPKYTVKDSLHISMPGCYVTMAKLKSKHAKLENELYLAEKMCSAASLKGLMEYPEKEFKEATEDLLNAEFHDILPGTTVKSGEENGLNLLSHGQLIAERLKTKAYFALSSAETSAKDGEFPILVFNAKPYSLDTDIECEFMLKDQNWSDEKVASVSVKDEDGKDVKFQVIKEESNINLDWRKRIIFEANLKPFTLSRYSVYVEFKEKEEKKNKPVYVFDNGRKHVEIDRKTGLMTSYAIDGKEYLKQAFMPVSFSDNSDPWAMKEFQLDGFIKGEKEFEPFIKPDSMFKGLKNVRVIEDGDIYLGIESLFVQDNTKVRVNYKIYKNNDDVDVDVNVFLGDIDRIIKLKLPTVKGDAYGQTAFGEDKLFSDGKENVSQRYIRIDDGEEKNFGIINDGVYGSSYKKGNLYISLVRGVSYCAHPILDRQIIPTDRYVKKIDQGESDFSFRITVAEKSAFERLADEFTQKPYACNVFPVTPDKAVKDEPFSLEISNKNVVLTCLKKKNGSKGEYVIRFMNNNSKGVKTELNVCGIIKELVFSPYEVKTLTFNGKEVVESDTLLI